MIKLSKKIKNRYYINFFMKIYYNKWIIIAYIETVLSKLKILLNSDLSTERNMSDKHNEEDNFIELSDDNTNIIEEDLVE